MDLEIKQKLTSNWFKSLQEMFCKTIGDFEKNKISFKSTTWRRNLKKDEGGGEYRILKDGKVFDKVGVNFSKVYGKFPKKFQQNIPGAQKDPRFWASGISVVMHMKNPLIPAMHFNTRYICTTFEWFGGGIDVTPSKKDNKEKNNKPKTETDINFNLFFFLELYNCKQANIRDNQSVIFPKAGTILIYITTFLLNIKTN